MGLFTKKKKVETGLIQLHNLLTHSFRNVQKDTAYILSWLNHLYHKNLQQEQTINNLQEQLKYTPKSKEEIKKIVDEFYSYESILNRIKELDTRIEELRKSHSELYNSHYKLHEKHQEIDQLHQRLEKLEAKKATIKEKIIKRITKNSKDYIKSIILSYIKKYSKITALQLKEMVVEEQALCSKSSFYRLLEELEEEPDIAVIKKGKEKIFLRKISLTNKKFTK